MEHPRIALGNFCRINLNSYEQPVHQAARAHALHNFLAQVTALAEVDRVHLLRFLRERCAKNFFAVARLEMFETHHACGFRAGLGRTRILELFDDTGFLLEGSEEAQGWRAGECHVGNHDVVPHGVRPGFLRHWNFEPPGEFMRLRAF